MHKRNAADRLALVSMFALATGFTPGIACAQTTSDGAAALQNMQSSDQDTQSVDSDGGEIVVTGSRIARPNLDSVSPVTSITAAEIQQTGNISTGDVLNNLPALASTYSQANSTRFLGTAGLNLVNLRNLGITRTLILFDSQRVANSNLSGGVDVTTLPSSVVSRVDKIGRAHV